MYRDELAKLSKKELIALGLAQAAQIEELTRRIAELEAKFGGPPKTPDNSSTPPSQARKPNRAERRAANKRKSLPPRRRGAAPACFGRSPPTRTGSSQVLQNTARTVNTR